MLITITRQNHTRWGVDGQLSINGSHIADTTEHPTAHLPEGIYTITRDRLILSQGNGPLLNTDGSICVGEHYCSGCVLKTREIFGKLFQRIRKTLERGKTVNLIIKSVIVIVIVSMTSCSTARNVKVVEHSVHDTLYINTFKHDSVYLFQSLATDRIHDTVIIHDLQREYKYQFLKDTVRVVSVDSIPVIHEVEVVKTERYIPSVYKWSLAICILIIIIALAIISIRVISAIRVL